MTGTLLTLKRRTRTDRSGAIMSRLSHRKRVHRRKRWAVEVARRLIDLPEEDVRLVYAMGNALIALRHGQMAPDDAAQFRALKAADPMDLEAIATWLIDHGYVTAAG